MIKIKMIDGTVWYADYDAVGACRESIRLRWDRDAYVVLYTSGDRRDVLNETHHVYVNPKAISWMEWA